jgi:hypothetical protein
VDVSLLGDRRLLGINGRPAHLTDDHPIPSADDPELLYFANIQNSLKSRHWPKWAPLEIGGRVAVFDCEGAARRCELATRIVGTKRSCEARRRLVVEIVGQSRCSSGAKKLDEG